MTFLECECNNHSEHCHLDLMILDQSGGTGGGVCHACQHNTMGSHCESCVKDYYRNPSKPINDIESCLGEFNHNLRFSRVPTNCTSFSSACDCDTIGSNSTECNVSDGQCDCKPGKTGRKCDTDRNTD